VQVSRQARDPGPLGHGRHRQPVKADLLDQLAGGVHERGAAAAAPGVSRPLDSPGHAAPSSLKNALDWTSRPRGAAVLQGKPTAVISASPSPRGAAWALADLRKVLTVAGANLTGTELAVPQVHTPFTPGGRLADPHLRGLLTQVISELVQRTAATTQTAVAGPRRVIPNHVSGHRRSAIG
jgi:hypothetical protein